MNANTQDEDSILETSLLMFESDIQVVWGENLVGFRFIRHTLLSLIECSFPLNPHLFSIHVSFGVYFEKIDYLLPLLCRQHPDVPPAETPAESH